MPQLPTLTPAGWVNDITMMSSRTMDYFIASDYSQSYFYPGEVSSLPYLIRVYGHEPMELRREVQVVLMRYFMRYFDDAQVEVNVKDNIDGRYNLLIDATLVQGEKVLSLGRAISIVDSKIIQVDKQDIN